MDDLLSFDSITLVFKHTRAILTGGDSPSLRLGTRVLPLGTAGGVSHVKSLRHLNAPLCAASGAAYQFVLDTATGDVIVGMASADLLIKWVSALVTAMEVCSPAPALPQSIDEAPPLDGMWDPVKAYGNAEGETPHAARPPGLSALVPATPPHFTRTGPPRNGPPLVPVMPTR